jgi:hypothetical protein
MYLISFFGAMSLIVKSPSRPCLSQSSFIAGGRVFVLAARLLPAVVRWCCLRSARSRLRGFPWFQSEQPNRKLWTVGSCDPFWLAAAERTCTAQINQWYIHQVGLTVSRPNTGLLLTGSLVSVHKQQRFPSMVGIVRQTWTGTKPDSYSHMYTAISVKF